MNFNFRQEISHPPSSALLQTYKSD